MVEIGAGDGGELPLTLEPFLGQCKVIAYEADDEARSGLAAKYGANLTIRGMFTNGWELQKDGPDIVVVDVDGIESIFMRSVLENSNPRVLMVEHYDKAAPFMAGKSQMEEKVPQWLLGMPLFNGFCIQAPSEHLDVIGQEFGYKPVFRTRFNSIYASMQAAEVLRDV